MDLNTNTANIAGETALSNLFQHMAYGGDYNPEQWPEEIWQEDVRLMGEAGVNLVSLGIFAWARLEPQPGQYDFAWLDRIMDLLHAHHIRVDLATATASPPPWLAKLYPESLPVNAEGTMLWPGSRQQYCPSSPAYRKAAQALVSRLAERYKDHPALVLWHINNEYACHLSECFCDESARDFRRWLQQHYGNLSALNTAWATAFWSQQYSDWDEINPPRAAPTYQNPTQQLDWRRFCSDALLACFELERAILKDFTPDVPITTNFMHLFKPLNYWQWAAREDLVSIDMYPDPVDPQAHVYAALNYDLMRSLGGGRPWLLMEQAPSQVNWRPYNLVKLPGQMRLWSHQALARGSAGVMFFQWRASKAGSEKFHSGMVPHAGTESRTWREIVALGHELRQLDAVLPTRVRADVAIVFDWESWWALELDSKPSVDLRLIEQLRTYYDPLFQRNITVDFVPPGADLQSYRLVLVPNLYLVQDAAAQVLKDYVAGGGTLVMSLFSGIVDEHDHIRLGGYPAPFRTLLGLRIEEFAPYASDQCNELRTDDGATFKCDLWSDSINLEGAVPIAEYADGFLSSYPAVTRHAFGQGAAYYVGTRPAEAGMVWVLDRACGDADIAPAATVPEGIEAVRREYGSTTLLYLLNHGHTSVEIAVEGPAHDLITGQDVGRTITLGPQDVAILTNERS